MLPAYERKFIMKTFEINGHEVEFTACTAIAEGDTERQQAVLVHDVGDEFRDGDGVIFGVDLPDNADSANALLQEYIETDYEVLSTIQPIE